MSEIVELDVSTLEESVSLTTTDGGVVQIAVMAEKGQDGTNGTNGSSTNAWNYKAKTNATSGYPGNGYMIWNNATQTSATNIIVSHLTDGDAGIELFLSFFVQNQKIFIQDRDDSGNNQVWRITGTPTVTGANTSTAYYTFPVTLVSSAGSAFTNNHSLLFGQIVVATNSVTSATTSDGTANLSVEYLTSSTGIATTGNDSAIATTGAESNIFTSGINAGIRTEGANANIVTESATASVKSTNFAAYASTGASLKTSAGTAIATFGVSGQNFAFASGTSLTFDNTSFAYGTGAAAAHRTALGLGTLATQSGTFSGTSSGTNTGDQTSIVGITGTTAQFNTALTDGDFATLAGSETLTNKTLTSPIINTGMTFGAGAAAATNTALGTTRVMRTTLATRTSGTMTADDTLVLPVLSGVTYRVRVHSLTKNSTATVGMVLRIDHPGITASGSDSVGHFTNGGGNAAITPSSSTSLTNSVNQNGQNLSTISEVIITPTSNGNVSVVWAARVPAGVETAGLNIGSYLEVIRLS